ncbi:hypothetical protein GCM10018789_59580 [Streptomyces werraensis]|nr:hypothetical protein GCM10018789_59580 [Streptomyces werraensis]
MRFFFCFFGRIASGLLLRQLRVLGRSSCARADVPIIAAPTLLRLTDPGPREQLEALPASAALIGISTDGRAIAVDTAPHILVCSGTGGSMTILRTFTAQFLHLGAHALVLDHTRIAHLWAKDLPTVTHRGKVAGIHDALVGLGSELERRIALEATSTVCRG